MTENICKLGNILFNSVSRLYEKLYEDNAVGKVSDEWFMQLSHKYETERLELKAKIKTLRQKLSECGQCEQERRTSLRQSAGLCEWID